MKIVLQKPQDISINGKVYPNEAGVPFEVNDRVILLLNQVGIQYEIIEAPVEEKVEVLVDPTVSQGEPAVPVEEPVVPKVSIEKKSPAKPKKVAKDGKKAGEK